MQKFINLCIGFEEGYISIITAAHSAFTSVIGLDMRCKQGSSDWRLSGGCRCTQAFLPLLPGRWLGQDSLYATEFFLFLLPSSLQTVDGAYSLSLTFCMTLHNKGNYLCTTPSTDMYYASSHQERATGLPQVACFSFVLSGIVCELK